MNQLYWAKWSVIGPLNVTSELNFFFIQLGLIYHRYIGICDLCDCVFLIPLETWTRNKLNNNIIMHNGI